MKPEPRTIQHWLSDIQRGLLRLPRFQRGEVWSPDKVEKFLSAILRDRPVGVFLVKKKNPDEKPLETRRLPGTPESGETCAEYLLDGQQRLTALWRSFTDDYKDRIYYVSFENKDDQYGVKDIEIVKLNSRNGGIIGDPVKEFQKRLIPINVLGPENVRLHAPTTWQRKAEQAANCNSQYLDALIRRLRAIFSQTDLSFFSLPQNTPMSEAIEIFIDTNRGSVPLSPFDLAVAQMELKASESLKHRIEKLIQEVPAIAALESPESNVGDRAAKSQKKVGDLVLKIQCLFQGRKPTNAYRDLNFDALTVNWSEIVEGIRWTAKTLEEWHIFDGKRLPTAIPLRVLPALHRHIPRRGAKYANAMRLVKKYLWWAFLTERYDRQANDRLKEDFDRLVDVLRDGKPERVIPVFKSERPKIGGIREAGWPKARGRLSRAILVACSLDGARDIASDRSVLKERDVHYHHIFPEALVKSSGRSPDLALNCMLLESGTNQEWWKKWPGDYLVEIVGASGYPEPEKEIARRLNTHLLPAQKLISSKYTPEADLRILYDEFIGDRARLVTRRLKNLLDKGDKE